VAAAAVLQAFVDRYGAEAIRGASDAQPFVDFNAEYDRLLSKAGMILGDITGFRPSCMCISL
jgi:hypothetical protein